MIAARTVLKHPDFGCHVVVIGPAALAGETRIRYRRLAEHPVREEVHEDKTLATWEILHTAEEASKMLDAAAALTAAGGE